MPEFSGYLGIDQNAGAFCGVSPYNGNASDISTEVEVVCLNLSEVRKELDRLNRTSGLWSYHILQNSIGNGYSNQLGVIDKVRLRNMKKSMIGPQAQFMSDADIDAYQIQFQPPPDKKIPIYSLEVSSFQDGKNVTITDRYAIVLLSDNDVHSGGSGRVKIGEAEMSTVMPPIRNAFPDLSVEPENSSGASILSEISKLNGSISEIQRDGVALITKYGQTVDPRVLPLLMPTWYEALKKRLMEVGMVPVIPQERIDIAVIQEPKDEAEQIQYEKPNDLVIREVIRNTVDSLDASLTSRLEAGIYVFKKINVGTDVVVNHENNYTSGMWTGYKDRIITPITSSTQTDQSKKHHYKVGESVQNRFVSYFSTVYCHRNGSGSLLDNSSRVSSPTRAQYTQLLSITNDRFTGSFSIGNKSTDHIYAVLIDRDQYKERIDAGNWQITLSKLSGSTLNNSNTGSNVTVDTGSSVFHLIDNSGDVDEERSYNGNGKDEYLIVSGTLARGKKNETDDAWGVVYPNLGVMIFNADVLNESCSFNTVTGSNVDGDNAYKLYMSISGSSARTLERNITHSFMARNKQNRIINTYLLNIKNTEYNFTNNPTWVSGSQNKPLYDDWVTNPTSYITSVGLYNDDNELLAVGKLSKPLKKDYSTEYNLRIQLRLDLNNAQ